MKKLILISAIAGSGKSTLAKKIAEHTGADLVSQDGMYFEKKGELNIDQDDDAQWEMLSKLCHERILEKLKQGKSVVFDDVALRFEHRDKLRELAKSVGATTKVIFLDTPIEVQKQRQAQNLITKERHDVKQEYLDQAIAELEIPSSSENVSVFKPETKLDEFLASLD
jgi:predicted kinase